jgi:hypothetical protein
VHSKRSFPFAGLFAVAVIWFLGMGTAALVIRPTSVVAFGQPAQMVRAVVASDGYLLNAGGFYIAARTGETTVRDLYAAGAWFVWPAIRKGCSR